MFSASKRRYKYLFEKRFNSVTDHEAVMFICHPEKSLAHSLVAMVRRLSIVSSAHGYTIRHRSTK